ncbi:hypothetical protein [Mastigocladopsis repens]|uniref:hypothetical protein n=1 Tax=Mastigocladopsis repens TaxID=221287 RepID=UPI000319D26A|nr:hypothetical protein [Mastigocladopsis repens]
MPTARQGRTGSQSPTAGNPPAGLIHRNALARPSVVHYFFVYLTQLQIAVYE